jgi:glycosyltransferase involved in cell wall biosynthesis
VNIGIFVDAYHPVKNGVVTSVAQLKDYLEMLGHQVYIFTASAKHAPKLDHVYRFPSFSISKATEARLAVVDINKVYKIAKPLKLDIIHTHSEFSLAFAAKKMAKKFHIPMIHTTHTLWEHYQHYVLKGVLFKWVKIKPIIKQFLKPYRYIIYPSKKAFVYFSPIANQLAKYRVIPNGIDREKFLTKPIASSLIHQKRDELGFDAKDKIMIFVGRIGPEKRVIELVKEVIPYCQADSHLKLIIVGDGGDLETLKTLTIDENLTKQIIFTGFIPWTKVSDYYQISDLFISLSISEIMPMTMIEALLSGLAIACIKDDAFDQMSQHQVNGVTYKKDSVVVNQAVKILNDSELLVKYKQASIEIAQVFSSENHGKEVLKFYEFAIQDYAASNKMNKFKKFNNSSIIKNPRKRV